ncbi:MAG: nitronate monooxygenase [Acidimicrobiaceae bacterium]
MGAVRELVRWPVIQAPMGGGPGRPMLAAAVSDAGGMGFLAAGYKTAGEMLVEISETKRLTDQPFGVNVFVPYAPRVDVAALDEYLVQIEKEASSLGVRLGSSEWNDDDWEPKLAALLQHPVAVVSFAFGCPSRDVVAELQGVGTRVMVTITHPKNVDVAVERGVDALCVQGIEAGAHRGGFTDDERDDGYGLLALIGAVREKTSVSLVAAGGIMDGRDLAAVLVAGADAAQIGTAFLRSPESGAHKTYKAALADPAFTTTAITRAFSGRRARGLVNRFMLDHPSAPSAYPQINGATRPLRAEAARRGDPHHMSLWAGQGFRRAQARPAGEIVDRIMTGYRGIAHAE